MHITCCSVQLFEGIRIGNPGLGLGLQVCNRTPNRTPSPGTHRHRYLSEVGPGPNHTVFKLIQVKVIHFFIHQRAQRASVISERSERWGQPQGVRERRSRWLTPLRAVTTQ